MAKGKEMLSDLIRYLRASLSRTREKTTTLGQEMELVRAYMNIYKVRMGDRLRYRVEMPAHLAGPPLSPMLIQPLVENAIKHGIEPKIDGGEIAVLVQDGKDFLRRWRSAIPEWGSLRRALRVSGWPISGNESRLSSTARGGSSSKRTTPPD